MDKPRSTNRVFLTVLVLVHAVFYLLACHFQKIYNGDSFEYIYEAVNIKSHFFFYSGNPGLPIQPEYMTQRQPGYPLFLLLFYAVGAGNWVILFFQNLLSIFNIYWFRKAILSAGYNTKYDWLLLLLIIAYPIQFIYTNTIAPDLLLQTFVVLYFYQFILLCKNKQLKNAILMSLLLIAGFMVKPVLYPFVLLHVIILMVVAIKQKMSSQRVLAAAMIPVIAILFYNYWNYTRTGKFHFTSNTAFNAVFYYYDYFRDTQSPDTAEAFLKTERANIAEIQDYPQRYDYANGEGTRLLKENFTGYMLYHLKHTARIFIEPGKAEIDMFTGELTLNKLYHSQNGGFYNLIKQKGMSGVGEYIKQNNSLPFVIIIFLFNLVRLVGLLIFFFAKRIDGMLRAFVFVLLAYFALAAGPIANTHYFMPVSLIAIGAAVMGYGYYFQSRKKQLVP
jgi:hypothetical protein